MAKVTYSVDEFETVFAGIVEDFIDDCELDIEKTMRDVGREVRDELKNTEPAGAGKYHDWADYSSGWQMSIGKSDFDSIHVEIANRKKPSLTHLLEKGHVIEGGHGRAKAFKHIEPAAEHGIEELMRRLTDGI